MINKFRLGDRSERIAALADEWGCSVTVATTRLLDAGLAAVDRDQKLTPEAIRRAFDHMPDRNASQMAELLDDWVAQKSTPDSVGRGYKVLPSPGGHTFGPDGVCVCGQKYTDDPQRCTAQIPAGGGKSRFLKQLEENARLHGINVKVLSRDDLFPPAPQWPTLPDAPGKRMFDEWLDAYQKPSPSETMQLLSEDDLRAAILNGYSPTRVDPFWAAENGLAAPTTNHANSMMAGPEGSNFQTFPSPACGGWGTGGWKIPTPEFLREIEAIIPTTPEAVAAEEQRQRLEGPTELPESLRDGSKVLERIKYLEEIGAPLKINFGLQITDATRDAMSGKSAAEEAFIDAVVKQVEVSLIQGDLPGPNGELCVDESCPGCGCLPGDGVTEGCTHPEGCGYYEDQDPRSMGWVGDNGLP